MQNVAHPDPASNPTQPTKLRLVQPGTIPPTLIQDSRAVVVQNMERAAELAAHVHRAQTAILTLIDLTIDTPAQNHVGVALESLDRMAEELAWLSSGFAVLGARLGLNAGDK